MSFMTVGIVNISISFSKPDVTDESFSVDLIAVVFFSSDSRYLTVNDAVAGRLKKWPVIHSFKPYEL